MATQTAKEARYIAVKRFMYGGRDLFPGEYVNPNGQRNDRVLFSADSRYVMVTPDARDREDWPCDRCGRHFAGESQLRAHQRKTYETEHVSPEHVAELKQQSAKRIGRRLQSETLADLAEDQGYTVTDVRSGPNRSDVPIIAPYG